MIRFQRSSFSFARIVAANQVGIVVVARTLPLRFWRVSCHRSRVIWGLISAVALPLYPRALCEGGCVRMSRCVHFLFSTIGCRSSAERLYAGSEFRSFGGVPLRFNLLAVCQKNLSSECWLTLYDVIEFKKKYAQSFLTVKCHLSNTFRALQEVHETATFNKVVFRPVLWRESAKMARMQSILHDIIDFDIISCLTMHWIQVFSIWPAIRSRSSNTSGYITELPTFYFPPSLKNDPPTNIARVNRL